MIIILGSCASVRHKQTLMEESNPNYKELSFFKNDTLEYVKQNFYENLQFIGKPLKALFNDLETEIIDFTPSSLFNPIDKSEG